MKRYESVLENCMTCPSSVTSGVVAFATRFVAAYLFLKVKGCRPMTYQHLTPRMFENARKNDGMVDQKIYKTGRDMVLTVCQNTVSTYVLTVYPALTY